MSRFVTGIGGIFFRSKDPKSLAKWYEDLFEINTLERPEMWKQDAGFTVFAPFKHDTGYFGRMEQQFMINFRVNNIESLMEMLRSKNVKSEPEIAEEEYGKFAWVYDPEGNKVELWEPKD